MKLALRIQELGPTQPNYIGHCHIVLVDIDTEDSLHYHRICDLPYANLHISAQWETDRNDSHPYAWSVSYWEPYKVDIWNIEPMHKLLTKIQRGLAKLETKYGQATDFINYVARVADVLGIAHGICTDEFNYDCVIPIGQFIDHLRYQLEAELKPINEKQVA